MVGLERPGIATAEGPGFEPPGHLPPNGFKDYWLSLKKWCVGIGAFLLLVILGIFGYLILFANSGPAYEILSDKYHEPSRFIVVYTQEKSEEALIKINDALIAKYPLVGYQTFLAISYFDDRDAANLFIELPEVYFEHSMIDSSQALPDEETLSDMKSHYIAFYRAKKAELGMGTAETKELVDKKTGETIKAY